MVNETSRNSLLLDNGRVRLPTIWRSMQPSSHPPPHQSCGRTCSTGSFWFYNFCHMRSVWNLNGAPLLPVLIHVGVMYSWGLVGWKHMHKHTGGMLGVIMHRPVGLPVHLCTNEQTSVPLLSSCPLLAPSTSPACLPYLPHAVKAVLLDETWWSCTTWATSDVEMEFCLILFLVVKALEKIQNHPRVDGE